MRGNTTQHCCAVQPKPFCPDTHTTSRQHTSTRNRECLASTLSQEIPNVCLAKSSACQINSAGAAYQPQPYNKSNYSSSTGSSSSSTSLYLSPFSISRRYNCQKQCTRLDLIGQTSSVRAKPIYDLVHLQSDVRPCGPCR